MNQLWKKGVVFATIGLFAFAATNCKPKSKDDNMGLLLAALYLSQQGYEATVTLTATLADSSGIATRDGKVTITNGTTSTLSDGQGTVSDFTACQTATALTVGSPGTGLDGEFVINFKVNQTSGNFNLTALGSTGASNSTTGACDLIAALDASTYTDAIGTASLDLNINAGDLTNKNQVTITANGFQITVKSVTVVIKGQYNLASPTTGENVCDGKNVVGSPETISGDITGTKTVNNSAILSGTVTIKSGGKLVVSPGATIFGNRGSSLFIQDNGTLDAQGTAVNPICFTSAQNPGSRYPSDWGGIVIIGNGVGTRNAVTEGTTPQAYPRTTNSTVTLKYVIVEFAGNEVAPGDELNGISSYTVTNSSNYSYVQVHRGLDDSFEWWGGTVTGDHLLSTGGLDDDFDMDEGFQGTLNTLIGVKYPTTCGGSPSTDPHGMEMDGSHSAGVTPTVGSYSNPTVSNFTLIGAEVSNGLGQRYREGMLGNFSNGLVYGFAAANFRCDNNTSGGSGNTNPTTTSVLGQSGKAGSGLIGSQCTGLTDVSLTATPITSLGNIAGTDCGFSATKPDFTTRSGLANNGGGATNWWSGWTVYRAR
ncbi:hypothetical protein [Leptospira sp. 'Mane']|uniref:hypothetical protein n=1 Tax=Leptospira sp. 'Mane' TaxID=3387407 RepID=UPI00398B0127